MDCDPCPEGYYCPLGTGNPIICPRGFYCPQNSSAPTPCPVGRYGNNTGKLYRDYYCHQDSIKVSLQIQKIFDVLTGNI